MACAIGAFIAPILGDAGALILARDARKEIDASGGTMKGLGLATAANVIVLLRVVLFVVLIAAITLLGNNATTRFSQVGP